MSQYDRRSQPSYGGGRQNDGRRQPFQPSSDFPTPTSEDLKAIICGGDAEKLVASAQKVGEELARRGLSSSQIRGVFGVVRRIEMRWTRDATEETVDREKKELRMLKPRLVYQVAKAKSGASGLSRSIEHLEPILGDAIGLVTERSHFTNFVDYFEAIVAYHHKKVADRKDRKSAHGVENTGGRE